MMQPRATILGVPQGLIWRTLPRSHITGEYSQRTRVSSIHCCRGRLLTVLVVRSSTDFYEVMDMLDKRLNDKGKNWRHVLKSLKVLDYCLHEGSELVVTWARKNIYIIKTLREFIYLDDDGRDVGASSEYSQGHVAQSKTLTIV